MENQTEKKNTIKQWKRAYVCVCVNVYVCVRAATLFKTPSVTINASTLFYRSAIWMFWNRQFVFIYPEKSYKLFMVRVCMWVCVRTVCLCVFLARPGYRRAVRLSAVQWTSGRWWVDNPDCHPERPHCPHTHTHTHTHTRCCCQADCCLSAVFTESMQC